jgi:hypothetical protein
MILDILFIMCSGVLGILIGLWIIQQGWYLRFRKKIIGK